MIISHDLGTTGDKATLVSNDGTLVAAVTATYPTDFGPRGKAEQDAEHWWTGLCTATKSLLDHAAVRPEHIDVVSFSGQMMGRYCWTQPASRCVPPSSGLTPVPERSARR